MIRFEKSAYREHWIRILKLPIQRLSLAVERKENLGRLLCIMKSQLTEQRWCIGDESAAARFRVAAYVYPRPASRAHSGRRSCRLSCLGNYISIELPRKGSIEAPRDRGSVRARMDSQHDADVLSKRLRRKQNAVMKRSCSIRKARKDVECALTPHRRVRRHRI